MSQMKTDDHNYCKCGRRKGTIAYTIIYRTESNIFQTREQIL